MSSIILRSLLRDPEVSQWDRVGRYRAHPVAQALRRLEEDLYDDWSLARLDRPPQRHQAWNPYNNEEVSRQVAEAVNRIQDFAQEIDQLAQESGVGRVAGRTLGGGDLVMKRAGDGSFQLALDVASYKPEDIKINLVDDNLVIEAKNESSGENSYHKSEFKRWFKLPKNCKVEEIRSDLTKDNKLLISLPSVKPAVEPKVRSIPINVDQRESVEHSKEPQKQAGDQSNKQNDTQAQKSK